MNACKWTRFYKVSPGGNTTILLDSSQVQPRRRAEAANKLMDNLSLGGEQVGFIGWPGSESAGESPALSMMGGEFCVNALRAYAAALAFEAGQETWRGRIASSGIDGGINAYVTGGGEDVDAAVEVPVGKGCAIRPLPGGDGKETCQGAIVELPGITHIVLPGNPEYEVSSFEMDRDLIRSAENWRHAPGLAESPAVGCIWFYLKKDQLSMQPLVWVRETDSSCFETSCGSGALALAIYLGAACGQKSCGVANDPVVEGVYSPPYASYTNFYRIMQPSGQPLWVSYSAAANALPESAWLGGPCGIVARGEVNI